MADDAVRYVKLLAVGDRIGVAATVVVICSLSFLTIGVSTSPGRQNYPAALEVDDVPGRHQRSGHRIDGYRRQKTYAAPPKATATMV
jgi:hypothetical protein